MLRVNNCLKIFVTIDFSIFRVMANYKFVVYKCHCLQKPFNFVIKVMSDEFSGARLFFSLLKDEIRVIVITALSCSYFPSKIHWDSKVQSRLNLQ